MEKIKTVKFIDKVEYGYFSVLFPQVNSQEAATILSNTVKNAFAIVQYLNEDGKIIYGVLYEPESDGEDNLDGNM